MHQLNRPGTFSVFTHDGHKVSVILTKEFVKRFRERKPDPDAIRRLLKEGIKDPLDMFLAMPGTRSMTAILKATRTKVNVVLEIERRGGKPPRVIAVATTVYVGEFKARDLKDYEFTFDWNPPIKVVFERDYEFDLVQMVLDDLERNIQSIKDNTAYHLGDDLFSYIAEREGDTIMIPDARWRRDVYVYEFAA